MYVLCVENQRMLANFREFLRIFLQRSKTFNCKYFFQDLQNILNVPITDAHMLDLKMIIIARKIIRVRLVILGKTHNLLTNK